MAVLSLFYILSLLFFLWSVTETEAQNSTLVKPGCQEFCGDVAVPYPFGIGKSHCYMHPELEVTCRNTIDGHKPFLKSIGMELLGVSMQGFVQVNNTVISTNCSSRRQSLTKVDLSSSFYTYSSFYNKFTAMGCDNLATLVHNDSTIGGCLLICSSDITEGCYGIGCCQTTIPPSINSFVANMSHVSDVTSDGDSGDCKTAFMVDQDWFDTEFSVNYNATAEAMKQREQVPAVLKWGHFQGYCDVRDVSFCDSDGTCWGELQENLLCVCYSNVGYLGYLSTLDYVEYGCYEADVRSCTNNLGFCNLICVDSSGNCSCPADYYMDPDGSCNSVGSGLGLLLLVAGVWWFCKTNKHRRVIRSRQRFFRRNGGLLLERRISSSGSNIEHPRIFKSRELEKATNDFDASWILGDGGQGTVYKGMLKDGAIVAVKKSNEMNERYVAQFINEVVILTQINHRFVVKLLGCCLETKVPLLIYMFIPNGTLSQHIHHPDPDSRITWDMRLRIATEVAIALSYMHSMADKPIYHRDIKPQNILLDNTFRAKIADFGISKLNFTDNSRVSTQIKGTFGYMDPECIQSNSFSVKSDVYSFGVVLIELITGQYPTQNNQSSQREILVNSFRQMEADELFRLVDQQVFREASQEAILGISEVAKRCVNPEGANRPTMREVVTMLEHVRTLRRAALADNPRVDQIVDEVRAPLRMPFRSPQNLTSTRGRLMLRTFC